MGAGCSGISRVGQVGYILILTAYSERELVERAATLAVQGYLVKPIREADLSPAIEIALARFKEWQALRVHSRTPGREALRRQP